MHLATRRNRPRRIGLVAAVIGISSLGLIGAIAADSGPVTVEAATSATPAPRVLADEATAPAADAAPAPAPTPLTATPVAVVTPVTASAPSAPVTVAPAPPATTTPEPRAEAAVARPADDTATLRIEIPGSNGATRTATLRNGSGAIAAGPLEATGDPLVIDGLDAGPYDLLLEDAYDGGGSTVARTPITLMAGGDHTVRCADSLDCTQG